MESGALGGDARGRAPFQLLDDRRLSNRIDSDATPEQLRKEIQDKDVQIDRLSTGLALLELKLQDAQQSLRAEDTPQNISIERVRNTEQAILSRSRVSDTSIPLCIHVLTHSLTRSSPFCRR